MSSSSDTDEEETQRLKESVSGVNFGPTIHSETSCLKQVPYKFKKKSLRNCMNDDKSDNVLQTTPEFRKFLAKKLDNFLEEEIKEKNCVKLTKTNGIPVTDDGIKLLLKSDVLIDVEAKVAEKKKKKRKVSTSGSSDDSESMEHFRAAAVNVDFIQKEAEVIKKYQRDYSSRETPGEEKKKRKRNKRKKKNTEAT